MKPKSIEGAWLREHPLISVSMKRRAYKEEVSPLSIDRLEGSRADV